MADNESPRQNPVPAFSVRRGIGQSTSIYGQIISAAATGDSNGGSVCVPPLPVKAKAGQPFPCLACGKKITVKGNSEWKKHLYVDLHAWMRLDMSCNQNNVCFKSRNDLTSHMVLDHRLEPNWYSF